MAITTATSTSLDETINRQTLGPLGTLLTKQTFWVFVAAVIAFIYLSFATTAFFTPRQPLQRLPQLRLCRDHGARHDGGDHHRRHRPLGRLGALLCRHGHRHDRWRHGLTSIWHAANSIGRRRASAALRSGGVSGVLIAYVGMAPFVVTLGMMSLARSLAMVMSNNTMVFQFGPDHEQFIALGGGSTGTGSSASPTGPVPTRPRQPAMRLGT